MNDARPRSLTKLEFCEAAISGVLQGIVNVDRRDAHGFDSEKEDGWGISIEGACAEKLVAKMTGLATHGALDFPDDGGDVGLLGVRSTPREEGRLILRDKDADFRIYVLVVGRAPRQRIAGWIRGDEAKQIGDLTDVNNGRPPAWFIRQEQLHPFESLPRDEILR